MMKFQQIDEDKYTVELNLDAINEIGSGLLALSLNGDGSSSNDRAEAIGTGFITAFEKFSKTEDANDNEDGVSP